MLAQLPGCFPWCSCGSCGLLSFRVFLSLDGILVAEMKELCVFLYISVCLCVCLCMCVLRANAMQADIKKKAQKIFRTGLTSHYAPATDGNEGVSLFSLHLHHAFLAFSSPTLSPSWLLPFLLGVPYVCSGLGVILAWSNIQIQNGGQMLWPPKAMGDHHYH